MRDEEVSVFAIERVPKGCIVDVPMMPRDPRKPRPRGAVTQFEILAPGLEPEVDCTRTEDGTTAGPAMRFLGSVASQHEMEDDPKNIVQGRIVGGHLLVMAALKNDEKFIVSGRVDPERPVTVRQGRRRKSPSF